MPSGRLHIEIDDKTSAAELVATMMPLVKRMAAKVGRGLPVHIRTEDLISAGMVGLMDASRRFEPARAESFVGYATLRIRGAMIDELRRGDILSQEARTKTRLLQQALRRLQAELQREPTTAEVATHLGIEEHEYLDTLEHLLHVKMVPLDFEHEDCAISDPDVPSPVDSTMMAELKLQLAGAIQGLPEKERLVLSLYYEEELTYKEIGEVMGLTAARICQIHGQAVQRLRRRFEAAEGSDSGGLNALA